jgi:hypothetical protein
VGDAGRVEDDESAAGGVVERAAQDHVDLDDRLRVEAAGAVGAVGAAAVGELGVEPFEVIGSKSAERPLVRFSG